jgi:putative ABC transport system permease protein
MIDFLVKLFSLTRMAVRNLFRSGPRVLIALVSITLGVAILVASSVTAQSIETAVRLQPAQVIGGDLSLTRGSGAILQPEDLAQLDTLQKNGQISRYTRIAYANASILFRTAGSGEMHFAGLGLGIEPDKYPLAGPLTIAEPAATGLATLLQQVGDVVVTRDIADEYHLHIGDRITLSNLRAGVPVEGTVRGVASDTPNHYGDKLYYSLDTAQALANAKPAANIIIANLPTADYADAVIQTLERDGWSVDWTAGRRDENTFNMAVIFLRSIGVLALVVSGMVIASTLKTILLRRQEENSILKASGYRSVDLNYIFLCQATLIGLTGSLMGSGLGLLLSKPEVEWFRRFSTLLYEWTDSPRLLAMGILMGVLTTLVYACWAAASVAQSQPTALLHTEHLQAPGLAGCVSVLLGLILLVPLAAISGWVMESLPGGIAVLAGIVTGIVTMVIGFGICLWICNRLIPLVFPSGWRTAFKSLRRRGAGPAFVTTAVFIAMLILSVTLGAVRVSQQKAWRSFVFPGDNLQILGSPDQESAIRQALQAQNPLEMSIGYRAALTNLSADGRPVDGMEPVLVGRSDPRDYVVSGAQWDTADGVYVYSESGLNSGSRVTVTFANGTPHTFPIIGTYTVKYESNTLYPPIGLLMTTEAFAKTTQPDSITFFARFDPEQVGKTAAGLAAALPQTTVVNLVDYAGRFMLAAQKLIFVPLILAGLVLLAGLLLVANLVSQSLQTHTTDLGTLKALGYTRRQILGAFGVEYGLVSLLGTAAAVLLVDGTLAFSAAVSHRAISSLTLSLPALLLIAVCGIGLPVLIALGVAWKETIHQ